MEIAPYSLLMGAITMMDGGIIVTDFTNRLWRGIKAFSSSPTEAPRVDPRSNEDARDIKEFANPLLGKNGASLDIEHAKYESRTVISASLSHMSSMRSNSTRLLSTLIRRWRYRHRSQNQSHPANKSSGR